MRSEKELEKNDKIKELKKIVKAGDTLYTILNHVSKSGMYRSISVYAIKKNKPICLDWYISKITHYKISKRHDGLDVQGCGMDMGFSIVYNLGRVLYPKGFKTWKGYWRNEPLSFDTDGGYAFIQKWL